MATYQAPANDDNSSALVASHGVTLSSENLRQQFTRGQAICVVGDAARSEAKLAINQSDMKFISVGQSVRLMLNSATGRVIESRLDSLSLKQADELNPIHALNFGGEFEAKQQANQDDSTDARTVSTQPVFEGLAELPENQNWLASGLKGRARIHVGELTLLGKFANFMHRTFRFEL